MSKLHIVFKLHVNLFTRRGDLLDRVDIPFSKDQLLNTIKNGTNIEDLEDDIMSDIQESHYLWITRVFLVENIQTIGYSFDFVDNKYHLWVKNADGTPIKSSQLSKALYFSNPENGGWYKDANLLMQSELITHNLGKVKLVPTVEKILVVTEQEVDLTKLPKYQR